MIEELETVLGVLVDESRQLHGQLEGTLGLVDLVSFIQLWQCPLKNDVNYGGGHQASCTLQLLADPQDEVHEHVHLVRAHVELGKVGQTGHQGQGIVAMKVKLSG